ncbi:hypothetical protein B0H15DRAFT_476818 [Mycena belliarum]|uniref:Uncharacterized protein n=1 Tax=Mycena belliarum TaxID=1033014 RepID=A0AAD6XKA6_9AGAR|nr:hypothetical protein B0H15DRAFT_476818 [Mycena belliae]
MDAPRDAVWLSGRQERSKASIAKHTLCLPHLWSLPAPLLPRHPRQDAPYLIAASHKSTPSHRTLGPTRRRGRGRRDDNQLEDVPTPYARQSALLSAHPSRPAQPAPSWKTTTPTDTPRRPPPARAAVQGGFTAWRDPSNTAARSSTLGARRTASARGRRTVASRCDLKVSTGSVMDDAASEMRRGRRTLEMAARCVRETLLDTIASLAIPTLMHSLRRRPLYDNRRQWRPLPR